MTSIINNAAELMDIIDAEGAFSETKRLRGSSVFVQGQKVDTFKVFVTEDEPGLVTIAAKHKLLGAFWSATMDANDAADIIRQSAPAWADTFKGNEMPKKKKAEPVIKDVATSKEMDALRGQFAAVLATMDALRQDLEATKVELDETRKRAEKAENRSQAVLADLLQIREELAASTVRRGRPRSTVAAPDVSVDATKAGGQTRLTDDQVKAWIAELCAKNDRIVPWSTALKTMRDAGISVGNYRFRDIYFAWKVEQEGATSETTIH
jgi:hypothetical protein